MSRFCCGKPPSTDQPGCNQVEFLFDGLNTINQWLELSLVIGYVFGTYQLARQNAQGYLWFVLMHLSCGYLMWVQSYKWLTLQQILSLVFIVDAYVMSRRLTPTAAT